MKMEQILSNEFLKKYQGKQPTWGYNGLGYIVYKRTYARQIENNGKEEWWQTVARCINGAQKIGADYTVEEAERLYDLIFNLKCCLAGRMLWQLGTPTVDRFGANSLLNCLSGDTKVLTRNGWFPIEALAGTEQDIVTENGKWARAPIKTFGQQTLYAVVFQDKNGNKKTIRATAEHDWLVLNKKEGGKLRVQTKDLKLGSKVPVVRPKNSSKELSAQGIQHGLVFGDGSCNGYESTIDLFGQTRFWCEKYFKLNRHVCDLSVDNGVRYGGMPNFYKKLPDISENKQYLSGFLAGWMAADGSVNKSNQSVRLFSSSMTNLDYARNIAAVLGYRTSEPYLEREENPFDSENPSPLWSIRFYNSDNPHHLIIRKDHKQKLKDFDRNYDNWMKVVAVEKSDKIEKVYCAQVPETHSFVIDGNILTGNCWYVSITKPEDFLFIFENLMLGGGVGFSVRREDIHELPRIKGGVDISHNQTKDADFIVPDSREGWIETLRKVLDAYFVTGKSFSYSTILVRGAGEPINGFGGTASGPQILHEGIEQICSVLESRTGKKLRSVDVLDICNIIGSIVVAGNVRRSAEIAIGDPDDYLFIRAKNWASGKIPNWREKSNNTIEADSFDHISNEIWSLGYEIDPKTGFAKGEPYGFFNRPLAQKYGRLKDAPQKDSCEGVNPCAEITLSSYECCNLVELFLNNIESEEELWDCARLLYKTQKAIAAMPFIHDETNEIVHKNMRLGMGVTGVCQSMEKLSWLDECYNKLKEYDVKWSKEKGYPESIRLTTVKPSGTLSLLAGASAGIHPAYSRYWIRRVEISAKDPLVEVCKQLGYNAEFKINLDGSIDYSTVKVEFPCESCDKALLAEDIGVIEQLDLVKTIQEIWSDNSVSVTAYYRPEDLDDIKSWMKENYKNSIKSVSFLLKDKHGFKQAPYESIDEKKYLQLTKKVKPIESLDFNDFGSEILNNLECEGGACPIK